MTHRCDGIRDLIEDHLDGLLPEADAERVAAHLGSCAGCRAAEARRVRHRDALYRPYAVAALPVDLRARIERAAEAGPVRPRAPLLRYAASFAAGVLVTLAVTASRTPASAPSTNPTTIPGVRAAPDDDAPATEPAPAPLRRIR